MVASSDPFPPHGAASYFLLALFLMGVISNIEIYLSASTESALSDLYAFEMAGAGRMKAIRGRGRVLTVASTMGKDGEAGHDEATLVINVWHEVEHYEPFRARIVSTSGDKREAEISYAASREAVLSSVDEWLRKVTN